MCAWYYVLLSVMRKIRKGLNVVFSVFLVGVPGRVLVQRVVRSFDLHKSEDVLS